MCFCILRRRRIAVSPVPYWSRLKEWANSAGRVYAHRQNSWWIAARSFSGAPTSGSCPPYLEKLYAIFCLLISFWATAASGFAESLVTLPDRIVIIADDLGAGELGCYEHPRHRTPHLDALARTGARFEAAYTSPVCDPTSITLMTGQYGFRTGVLNFSGLRAGPPLKHEGADNIAKHLSFAQVLKQYG